jgi:5-methylcytosine-specific restriction endonuclease McrA
MFDHKKYRQTHKEQFKAYQKKYEKKNPKRIRELVHLKYLRRKKYQLDYQKQYRILNKEKVAVKRRQWRTLNRERLNEMTAQWKLRVGVTKRRRGPNHGLSGTREYQKLYRVKSEKGRQFGGTLTVKTIQQIYENNIKHYGTLTCYLCEKPISFGDDHLEHKVPLSRGGTNISSNLGIAHGHCNCKKWNRTEEEYRLWQTQQVQQLV